MKIRVLFLLLFFSPLVSAEDWYIGEWLLDLPASEQVYEKKGKLNDEVKLTLKTMASSKTKITQDKIIFIMNGIEIPSSYKVISRSKNKVKLNELTLAGKPRERILTHIDNGKISMTTGKSAPLIYNKSL